MKFKFISVLAIILLSAGILAAQSYAKGGADDPVGDDRGISSSSNSNSQGGETEQRGQEPEVRGQEIEARGRTAEGEAPRGSDSVLPLTDGSNSVNENESEIKGAEFEIRGTIDSISGNTFTISGQSIQIDPSRVANFQQTEDLRVGKSIKVEGVIDNGNIFAREIKPLVEPSVENKEANNLADDQQNGKVNNSQKRENVDRGLLGNFIERIFRLFFK